MRILIIHILVFVSLLSCTTKTNVKQVKSNSNPSIPTVESQSVKEVINHDTIVDIKKIGLGILKGGKISSVKDKHIYQLIDSLRSKDSIDRSFYFNVFNEIRKEAGGYIAEYVDLGAREYCRNFPNEFFLMPNSLLKSYAYDIGEEIRTEEEDPITFAEDYIATIKEKINPTYLPKVETFSQNIFDEMESRK